MKLASKILLFTPLLGWLGMVGTVVGMMRAFDTLGASGTADPQQLADAIGNVLISTSAGLMLAILATTILYPIGVFMFIHLRATGRLDDRELLVFQIIATATLAVGMPPIGIPAAIVFWLWWALTREKKKPQPVRL